MARPSKYSEELVNKICERIADGESLRAICREDGMPDHNTVIRWKNEKPEFCSQYARAREDQADGLFDQAIDMLKEQHVDNVKVQSAKLNFDIIKWTAGKLAPKKYGDKIDMTSSDGTMSPDKNIQVTFVKAKSQVSEKSDNTE
ncbi:hypothetical protein CIN_21510 [Commensalibacter intestini A911]|uniref:Terminase small subunit n=1 Tax=Commensalibacter intestini A911 TaxID=1088868 RepID=G6F3F5_9PROT|nr:hypothetical protein [Commensalibacter intestini]EHD12905.1 hypothetical protein CIN_21510 [Commensalibacter intestini A911]